MQDVVLGFRTDSAYGLYGFSPSRLLRSGP